MDAVGCVPRHYRERLVLMVMLCESYQTPPEHFGAEIGVVKSRVNHARAMVAAAIIVPVAEDACLITSVALP